MNKISLLLISLIAAMSMAAVTEEQGPQLPFSVAMTGDVVWADSDSVVLVDPAAETAYMSDSIYLHQGWINQCSFQGRAKGVAGDTVKLRLYGITTKGGTEYPIFPADADGGLNSVWEYIVVLPDTNYFPYQTHFWGLGGTNYMKFEVEFSDTTEYYNLKCHCNY